MFCTDTLRYRETARRIIEEILRIPITNQIIIDFKNITFASRSFLHELLSNLGNRSIKFTNQNHNIEQMIEIIQGMPVNTLMA